MRRWVSLLLCVLAAGSAQASGITSFEPDSARAAREREPMIETPLWLGWNWSVGSQYRPGGEGLVRGPMNFSGLGFGATWPWKSRRQGYLEWHYGVRNIRFERQGSIFTGSTFIPYTFVAVERVDMLAMRGGIGQQRGQSAPHPL